MFFQQLPYKLIIYAAAQLPGHCLGGSLLLGLSDCAKMRTTTAQREAAKSIAKLQPEGLGMRRVCDLPPTPLEVFFLVMTDRFNQIFIQFWSVLGTFLVSSKGSALQPCPFNWALHWSWAPQPIERTWRRKAVANSFLIRGSKLLLVGGWTTYPWNVGQFLAWNSQCSTNTHTYIYI